MGQFHKNSLNPNMKSMIVVLALVGAAVAEPEADPYFYSGYGLRSTLGMGYSTPYTGLGYRSSVLAPVTTGYTGYTGLNGYTGYSGLTGYTGARHYIGKREAEAEPEAEAEADPLLYGYPYGGVASTYTGLSSPLVRSVYNPVKTYGSVVAPVTSYKSVIPAYTGYSGLVGHTEYTGYTGLSGHYIGKREAEADAYTVYGHPAYTGYTGLTGYTHPFSGYTRSIHHGLGYSNLFNRRIWG